MKENSMMIGGFFVHDLFYYDDGKLIWKKRPVSHFFSESISKAFNTKFEGREAGTVSNKSGYAEVRVSSKAYLVHRIIYLMKTGDSPECVDHINRDKTDNRIENLRAATKSQNGINSKMRRNNTSGYKGVSFCKVRSMWKACIKKDSKSITIGYFSDINIAAKARLDAEINYYGEFSTKGEETK